MNLIKVTCELRYAKRMSVLKTHESVFEKIVGKAPENIDQWLTPGLRIEVRERKEVVIIEPSRTLVDIQEPISPEHAQEVVRQRMEIVRDAFDIPDVSRWGCRTIWVGTLNTRVEQLQKLFKERLLANSALVEQATALAVTLDFASGNSQKVTLSCGITWPSQLIEQHVPWATANYPDALILANIDVGLTGQSLYSKTQLGKFLRDAFEAGTKYSAACFDVLHTNKND